MVFTQPLEGEYARLHCCKAKGCGSFKSQPTIRWRQRQRYSETGRLSYKRTQRQSLSPKGFRWSFEHGPCDLRDRSLMVLKERTRILQSTNAKTQYITIPSVMVSDSQYPFEANDEVEIVPGAKRLIVQLAPKKHQP
jgi:hypothetical protein